MSASTSVGTSDRFGAPCRGVESMSPDVRRIHVFEGREIRACLGEPLWLRAPVAFRHISEARRPPVSVLHP